MFRIKVGLGKTINLGNYESLRVDVEASQDFEIGAITKDEAFVRVSQECNRYFAIETGNQLEKNVK